PGANGGCMDLLTELKSALGAEQVLTGADAAPYLTDWRGRYTGSAYAVTRPANTHEVAQVVKLCRRYGAPIVPQGGNTGLAGATAKDTIAVGAGRVLRRVQDGARQAGRLFPLSLVSEGRCTVGGNLATSGGGTQVLRYGNARELALGLEVVTAEGEVWDGLRGLRKDNTGYDLRDLYIGSEGTLGVITAATLKLYPLPVASCTALLALDSIDAAVELLSRA